MVLCRPHGSWGKRSWGFKSAGEGWLTSDEGKEPGGSKVKLGSSDGKLSWCVRGVCTKTWCIMEHMDVEPRERSSPDSPAGTRVFQLSRAGAKPGNLERRLNREPDGWNEKSPVLEAQ